MTALTKDVVIGKYVELRDEVKAIGERHAAELAPYTEQMDRIEAWLLANLNQDGVDSYKTSAGTAYKSTTTSVKLADREAFMGQILHGIAAELRKQLPIGDKEWADEAVLLMTEIMQRADWSLADIRVSKAGVTGFIETEGAPPPGVVLESFTKVNVRRA